jgi:hypothetical protein
MSKYMYLTYTHTPELDSWRVQDFSFPHSVRTSCVAQPASYSMGTSYFPGVKRPEREAGHTSSSNVEVRTLELYLSTPKLLRGIVFN